MSNNRRLQERGIVGGEEDTLGEKEQAMADYEINSQPHNDYNYIEVNKEVKQR